MPDVLISAQGGDDFECLQFEVWPQRACAAGYHRRDAVNQGNVYSNWGQCHPNPVRVLAATASCGRWLSLSVFAQVPSFEMRTTQPFLALSASKVRTHMSTEKSTVLVLADRVAEQGGIQGKWLERGLDLLPLTQPVAVSCGSPLPCNVTSNCSTIWLEPTAPHSCASFNTSHVTISVSSPPQATLPFIAPTASWYCTRMVCRLSRLSSVMG